MDKIVRRWEWRAFGSHFETAERVFASMTPLGDPAESDETYILGPGDVNVKIRFSLLDIKKLMEVDAEGLELWTPISKVEFPVPAEAALEVFDAWGLDRPGPEREIYELDHFLDELINPHPELEIVSVHKKRVRYSFDGCMSELTEISANGREAKTNAVEDPDQATVVSNVGQLGVSDHVNMSYNRGLRCLLGLSPVRYAAIDIGTNSVKFHIAEQEPDGTWIRVVDRAAVTRLGEGLDDSGEIQPEAMERTIGAVEEMVSESRAHDVLAVAAVGTAALRIAGNTAAVIEKISERTGLTVEVVSGEEESRLAYLAVSAGVGLDDGSVVVLDTGGGSTQFTFGRGGDVDERYSVNVGAVTYTERFGLSNAIDDATIIEARRALREDFASLDGRTAPEALIGMGGAITNLTAVSLSLDPYDPDVVQGATITAEEVDRQIAQYQSMEETERRSVTGLQPNRAPVILAGALIVSTVMEKLGQQSLVVSDRGLRHGLIPERFGLFPTS